MLPKRENTDTEHDACRLTSGLRVQSDRFLEATPLASTSPKFFLPLLPLLRFKTAEKRPTCSFCAVGVESRLPDAAKPGKRGRGASTDEESM